MRNVIIALASIIFVLAAFALTPAGSASALLAATLAAAALLLLGAILYDRQKPQPAPPPATLGPAPAAPPASDADVVNFLAILQEKGRFVDFLMGDVTRYSDEDVGRAGRILHEGCKAALLEHFGIIALRSEEEGARITVPSGYAADEYRLIGRLSGAAPFSGTLIHHGWKAEWVKLPRLTRAGAAALPTIAPAEVEIG